MENLIKEHPILASIVIIFISLVGVFPPMLLILSAGSLLVPEGSFTPLFMLWLASLGFLILPVLSLINIRALIAMANGEKMIRGEKWFEYITIVLGILCIVPYMMLSDIVYTAGWSLSQRVAPQNISYDEHYLCTVAAGGHRKVVKPIRMGVRHGHRVTVNRQLCIANAFEQILEERTPRFHRHVRHFYDTYGFPVARLIRSRYVADVIYFLMKPLEWFFLIVIYFCDVKPENRIAMQYLPKPE